MYDKERLGKIFSDIERYMADLRGMNVKSAKDLEDKRNFYSVSMLLFSMINRAIDLGEEMVSANNLGTPSTYKDVFHMLMKGGIISKRLKEDLSELAFYRNLFSHDYYNFTEKEVFDALSKIGAVNDFARRAKAKINGK